MDRPPSSEVLQALSDLADSCDSLICRGGALSTLVILLTSCLCVMRCCCCPRKRISPASPPSYQRTEVEMNGISTSEYTDENGFKDEPDDFDYQEQYGEFNPDKQ